MTPKFTGRIDENLSLLLQPKEAEKYKRHLQKLKGCLVWHTVEKKLPTRSDPLRKYYFKWVMGPMAQHTYNSKEVMHEDMKRRYASEKDEFGILHVNSVWSDKSKMTIPEKKAFILDVRNFALDFLGVTTPEFEPRPAVE